MVTHPAGNGLAALAHETLFGARSRCQYNPHEQRFSLVVQRRLTELLQGDRNDLLLLRLYPGAPTRLGVMGTPSSIDRAALRLPVVQQLLEETLLFLYDGSAGGPTAQEVVPGGGVIERRTFPTRYPHIVIEREDHFTPDGPCEQATWCARRVQNQRAQTQINRWLDVANLGAEVAGALLR